MCGGFNLYMQNEMNKFMKLALLEARKAAQINEVPVGAVIVLDGKVIAKAHNKKETNNDPLGHAEILVIKKAVKKLGSWRLNGCSLYVTLEPCSMCAGAIMHSRISKVIYGASDPKGGAMGEVFNLFNSAPVNHKPEIISGILQEEAKTLLQTFFKAKRK